MNCGTRHRAAHFLFSVSGMPGREQTPCPPVGQSRTSPRARLGAPQPLTALPCLLDPPLGTATQGTGGGNPGLPFPFLGGDALAASWMPISPRVLNGEIARPFPHSLQQSQGCQGPAVKGLSTQHTLPR